MTSALYVTTKDFCKRARLGALLAVGTMVLGPLLFLIISRVIGSNFNFREQVPSYHFAYLALSWIIFIAVSLHALTGCQKICVGLPVSSKSIATWMMLISVGLVVVLQLVTNGAYRLMFFNEQWFVDAWPLLGPLLFISTALFVGHSVFWSLHAPSFTRCAFWFGLIIVMLWWFISRYYPNGFKAEFVPWRTVTLSEFICMQLVSVAAWYQGTRAFAQVRSGTAFPSPQWDRVQVWWSNLITGSIPEKQLVPLSRSASLARLHWRDSCQRAVILCGTLFGFAVLVISLMNGLSADMNQLGNPISFFELTDSFLMITMLFSIVAAVIVAILLGEGVNGPGRTEMKRFLAIASLSDRDLVVTLFRNMLKTFVSTFLFIQCGLVLCFVGVLLLKGPEYFTVNLRMVDLVFYRIFWSLVMFWVIAANMVSIWWTGRTWFYYTMIGLFFSGLFELFLFAYFAHRIFQNNTTQWYFEAGIIGAIYFLIAGGFVTSCLVACRRKLIKRVTGSIALLFWLTGSIVYATWFLYQSERLYHNWWVSLILISSLMALSLAPFATIPLALSWNRHR